MDGLASMVLQGKLDDRKSQILKECLTQHYNFFSLEAPATNEKISPQTCKLDNTFSSGNHSSFFNPYDHANPEDMKAYNSMCLMLNDNTEHHFVIMTSFDNAIDSSAHQHDLELKCIESSINPPHSFSDCD